MMQFGYFTLSDNHYADNQRSANQFVADITAEALYADQLGMHSAWIGEHHFNSLGVLSCPDLVLSYIAARTKHIRLAPAVTVLPLHHPIRVAEQWSTLDLLSDGRVDFAIGRGYDRREYEPFNVSFDDNQGIFEEGLEVVQKLWAAEERISHHGKYWKFDDAIIDPRPLQSPHPPIWIGAASEHSIQRAAGKGYNLLLDQFSDSAQIGGRFAWFRKCVLETGAAFDPMRVGVTRAFHLTSSEAETREALAHHQHVLSNNRRLSSNPNESGSLIYRPPVASGDPDDTWLIGTPEQVVRRLHSLKTRGIEYVLLLDTMGDSEGARLNPPTADTPLL